MKGLRIFPEMLHRFLEIDARLSGRLRVAEKPGLLRSLAAFFAHSGDSWFLLLGLGGIWLSGDGYWRSRAQALGIAILITALFVMLIKFTVQRKRPEGEWGGIYRTTDPHSFPSGHAARAFMLAVVALGSGPAWLGVTLALWAPFVAMARVAMGLHYLSDVMAGGLFGLIAGFSLLPVVTGLFL